MVKFRWISVDLPFPNADQCILWIFGVGPMSLPPGDHGLCGCHDLCQRTARLGHGRAVATLFGDPSADAGWGWLGMLGIAAELQLNTLPGS